MPEGLPLLVIQTRGFRDDLWIDMNGAPPTSAGKMTERLRRPNYGTLDVEITVEDPKAYTHIAFTLTTTPPRSIDVDPKMSSLRSDSRFQKLRASVFANTSVELASKVTNDRS